MADYAPRIRAARAYKGLTQEQLADELGVEVQTIKRRESGEQQPKKGERIAIAAICEVPVAFLEEGFAGGWRPSDQEIRVTAELLGPQLLEAVRALSQAEGTEQRGRGEPDHPGEAGAGAGE